MTHTGVINTNREGGDTVTHNYSAGPRALMDCKQTQMHSTVVVVEEDDGQGAF